MPVRPRRLPSPVPNVGVAATPVCLPPVPSVHPERKVVGRLVTFLGWGWTVNGGCGMNSVNFCTCLMNFDHTVRIVYIVATLKN